MTNLEPIKARLAAATPGPWELCTFKTYPDEYPNDPDAKKENWIQISEANFQWSLSWCERRDFKRLDAPDFSDAQFIAHAPEDVAALVAEVERLRGVVERHRREALGVNILDEPALADQRLWREVLE